MRIRGKKYKSTERENEKDQTSRKRQPGRENLLKFIFLLHLVSGLSSFE